MLCTREDIQEAYNRIKHPQNITHYLSDYDDDRKAIRCTIQNINNQQYIVFQSSGTRAGWILDCKFPKRYLPFLADKRIKAHGGFVRNYMKLAPKLYNELTSDTINITGYSMGASIAQICALDLHSKGYNVNLLVFDPLRIANRRFKEYFNKLVPSIYITYGNSTVNKLLREFNFHHCGLEFHYGPLYKWWKYNHRDHKIENLTDLIL